MKQHTNDFKEEIKLLGRQQAVRITYTLNEQTTVITSEDVNSVTPNYKGNLLKSVMKVLDLDLNVDIPLMTQIKFEYGLLVNGEYEYLDYGNYIVYSSEKQEDSSSYKIKCYDKLLYSMVYYSELPNIIYPITIYTYLSNLCNVIGLSLKEANFANMNKQLPSDLFKDQQYTVRDIFDQIAQVTGGTICMTLDDKVEVRYIQDTNDTIDESYINDINVNFGEKYRTN